MITKKPALARKVDKKYPQVQFGFNALKSGSNRCSAGGGGLKTAECCVDGNGDVKELNW